VGIAGPHLTVTGAIFGDKLATQRLTDYIYLGAHPSCRRRSGLYEGIRRVARIPHALSVSTKLLKDYYLKLDNEAGPSFPTPLIPPYFQDFTFNGATYKLEYTKRMAMEYPDKAVFEASIKPTSQAGGINAVVVKFSHSYCKSSRVLLAEKSFAPRLLYCEEVESVGMYVVIMNLVVGKHVVAPRQDKNFTDKLRMAVRTLHDAGFVHGDLREPNALVTDDGDIKIVDFDWYGEDGEALYPADINLGQGVGWDPDVARGGLIKKEHDRTMFCRLTGLEWEANP
jgi:serine/threonine protein kinase